MLFKPDPLGVPRNPLAIYLLLLACVSGFGMMVGTTTAGAVERSVPAVVALLWGTILFAGSAVTLLGMFWPGDIRAGLLLKRTGMFSVGIAAVVYGVIVGTAVGVEGLFAAGTIIGFGLACFAQFHIINRRIHEIVHLTRVQRDRP